MTCWAIGDIQGCADSLNNLLDAIAFNADRDQLWCCGDLVNRGPQSLQTLRVLQQRRDNVRVVLGNHDLHLLAVAAGCREARRNDTFDDVMQAPDRESLLRWLYEQDLAIYDASRNLLLTHAGLPPQWTAEAAQKYGDDVMQQLRSDPRAFFAHMYGNEPALWRDDLQGVERWRYSVNALTRMRFVDAHGALDMKYKGSVTEHPPTLQPWFRYPNRRDHQTRIVFGHWAALQGHTGVAHCIALDTGCVWGNKLTAYDVDRDIYCHVAGWAAGATLASDD